MSIYPFIRYTIIIATLAWMSWVVAPSVEAADKPSQKNTSRNVKASTAPTSSEAGRSIVAPGSAEDSQKACLDRIPKDASAGQRMLAEDSCKRDQSKRSQQ